MAPTSFCRHFRKVASVSPIQYQKTLRLHKARRLMISSNETVANAAYAVGCESPTQFSREYKRHFCVSPKRDVEVGGGRSGMPRVYAFADALPRGSASLETSIPSNARSLVFASSPPA